LDFGGENPAELKYNSEWLAKLTLADILELTSKVTYAQLVQRDMFQKRITEGHDLYFHEFMYPIMQGYDSVVMDVDGEVGGSDQTFNMLVGRDLIKKIKGKEKFVLTTKLLADAQGVKMGKTMGNMVTLADSAEEMFGKVMSWIDRMIIPGFELCTYLTDAEIEKIKKELDKGENPKNLKMMLGEKIVEIYYGEEAAKEARRYFENTFGKKEIPTDIETVTVIKGAELVGILVETGFVKSKSDFRRLVDEGAVEAIEEGEIKDPHYRVGTDVTLKIGKRRFLKLRVKID
jgi:tyrosyl-tRNA synthetase